MNQPVIQSNAVQQSGEVRPAVGSGRGPVERAIAGAARASSVDFDYLIAKAQIESAMNPRAKAATSSATGLFQFIESTWLNTLKRHGARFGLGQVAEQIAIGSNGQAYVRDSGQRSAILALRNDPQIASYMAAGLAEDNRAALIPVLGREPDMAEMYLAHFLGSGGASRFLKAHDSNPAASAAALFPRPAAANRPIFFDSSGHARSLDQVMHVLRDKMDRALAQAPNASGAATTLGIETIAAPSTRGAWSARTIGQSTGLPPSPPAVQSAERASMSDILQSTFANLGSEASQTQVRQAYQQLRSFGL